MDFRSLRYVLAVAEKGGISTAAKELGISQPSLSRYLQHIHESVGLPLFERNGGEMTPTFAGERYLSAAQQMLRVIDELPKVGSVRRTLRITCPPFEGTYIHPFALRQFCERHPDVEVVMFESMETERRLATGEADLAIASHKVNLPGFAAKTLIQDEILLVTAHNHPMGNQAVWKKGCRRPWLDIRKIWGEPFIKLFPDQRVRELSDALLAREKVTPKILMQTRSVLNAIRIAATGAGACFAPALGMQHFRFNEPPAFFSVGDPLLMDVYCIHRGDGQNELVDDFIKLVEDFLR